MNTNESKIITCENCGCIIENEDDLVILRDGKTVCRDCAELLGYVQCEDCEEWIPKDEATEYDGIFLCEDCRDDRGLVQCDECGEWFDESDLTEIDMGWRRANICLCEDCQDNAEASGDIFYCEECEEWYSADNVGYYTLPDGSLICSNCYENHDYCTCADCGDVIRTWQAEWNDECEEWFCESCANSHRSSRKIHDYGYKPGPVFHGIGRYSWETPKSDDPITIGFELEIDKGDDRTSCAEDLSDNFDEDTLYLKSDSSVDFEIVTHPHTLKAYMEDFDFDTLCKIPPKYGYSSHNAGTCGLHCHVGRAQLAPTFAEQKNVIAKIALLMYRHWDQLVKFSRRSEGQLSRWAAAPRFNFPRSSYTSSELREVVFDYYGRVGRYQALNLEPRNTIEFRLWRGTLKPVTLKATIQLTSNIVEYCKAHSFKDVVSSRWTDVCDYEHFDELSEYLAERNLLDDGDPEQIPYGEAPAVTVGQCEFHEGDLVKIVNSEGGLVTDGAIGARGTVVCLRNFGDTVNALLRFDRSDAFSHFVASEYGHCGDGQTPGGDGYWVYPENIRLLNVG